MAVVQRFLRTGLLESRTALFSSSTRRFTCCSPFHSDTLRSTNSRTCTLNTTNLESRICQLRLFASEPQKQVATEQVGDGQKDEKPISGKAARLRRLKVLTAQYGSVVVVFHVSISLTSLGLMYAAVSAGLDIVGLAAKVGVDLSSSVVSASSTFAVAYVAHKMLAPCRIAITAVSVPLIVKSLRKLGIMRKVSPPKAGGAMSATNSGKAATGATGSAAMGSGVASASGNDTQPARKKKHGINNN